MSEQSALSRKFSALAGNYDGLKRVNYLINSTPDFVEVLKTVNEIFSRANTSEELLMWQQRSRFDVVALQHSPTSYVAAFYVPIQLLQETDAHQSRLVYDVVEYAELKPKIAHSDGRTILRYAVENLFDLNSAFHGVESILARAVSTAQLNRVRRTMEVTMTARTSPIEPILIAVSVEAVIPPEFLVRSR